MYWIKASLLALAAALCLAAPAHARDSELTLLTLDQILHGKRIFTHVVLMIDRLIYDPDFAVQGLPLDRYLDLAFDSSLIQANEDIEIRWVPALQYIDAYAEAEIEKPDDMRYTDFWVREFGVDVFAQSRHFHKTPF